MKFSTVSLAAFCIPVAMAVPSGKTTVPVDFDPVLAESVAIASGFEPVAADSVTIDAVEEVTVTTVPVVTDLAVVVSRADELCLQIDTECNELTPECAENLKVMIRGVRDGAANKNPGALQLAAHEFSDKMEDLQYCVQPLLECSEKLNHVRVAV